MLSKELLRFYTYLADDPDAPDVYVNLASFYKDLGAIKEFKYETDQQGYSLQYKAGAQPWQTVDVKPPYRYVYGINRLQASVNESYNFDYPEQLDQATVGFDIIEAPSSILERACDVTAVVTITGLGNETLYIGNFVNESREVLFTINPINLNIEGLAFLYSVESRDGAIIYQLGVDYEFDAAYQSITFADTIEFEPYTPIVIRYGVEVLDGQYQTITTNGSYNLPPAFTYGVAITGPQGTSSSFSLTVTWTSVIDVTELNTSYVLTITDEAGCHTLLTSATDNIVVQDPIVLANRITFKDFTDSIRTSTPVPLEADVSLASIVPYEELEILASSVPGYSEKRNVVFNQTDNPVDLSSLQTETNYRSGSYQDGPYRASNTKSLPNANGICAVESKSLVNGQAPNSINPTFSLAVPFGEGGLWARYEPSADMSLVNPITAGWGLLLAGGHNDSDVINQCLKGLVYQAKQRGWIKLENGSYVIDKTVAAGLPIYFNLTDPDYEESFKEVGANAFLGLAACIALLCLVDDPLRTYYAMRGSDTDFEVELLLTLEAMALFVANGVSKVTWYAAYKHDGSYSYDQPSLSATIYADLFLSYFLALRYNPIAHYVAAKLDYNLSLLPSDLESPFYQQFYERDYTAVQYPFDDGSSGGLSLIDQSRGLLYSRRSSLIESAYVIITYRVESVNRGTASSSVVALAPIGGIIEQIDGTVDNQRFVIEDGSEDGYSPPLSFGPASEALLKYYEGALSSNQARAYATDVSKIAINSIDYYVGTETIPDPPPPGQPSGTWYLSNGANAEHIYKFVMTVSDNDDAVIENYIKPGPINYMYGPFTFLGENLPNGLYSNYVDAYYGERITFNYSGRTSSAGDAVVQTGTIEINIWNGMITNYARISQVFIYEFIPD